MKVGAPLPLSHLVIGECTNAPFATEIPLFFDLGRRFLWRVIFAHFPPGPESFLQNLLIWPRSIPTDSFPD